MFAIVLAAGRGTRMKSDRPKVLFDVCDRPMVCHALDAATAVSKNTVVVVGYQGGRVREEIEKEFSNLNFVTQDPPSGTGDAVKIALKSIEKKLNDDSEILVVNGDLPLIRSRTLERFVAMARKERLDAACLSILTKTPFGLGRILRDSRGSMIGIREEKDANASEKKIREVNGGVYFFKYGVLKKALANLKTDNAQKEFYLTDVFTKKQDDHKRVNAIFWKHKIDLQGVNNTYELGWVRQVAQMRYQKKICEAHGVDLMSPGNTWVSMKTQWNGACEIGPGVLIKGQVKVGREVKIEGNCVLENCEIADGSVVQWGSVIRESSVGERCSVGPMSHLRPGAQMLEESKVGNFVELKKTTLGKKAKALHLTYLGDAEIGESANIGCGTITCNYDGVAKHKTKIGKEAFIGSDTQLVAPVTVGDGAYVASGTTVTNDVPDGALALSRPELVIKPGYASKLKARFKAAKKE